MSFWDKVKNVLGIIIAIALSIILFITDTIKIALGLVIAYLITTMFGGFISLVILFCTIFPIVYILNGNIWISLMISSFVTIPLAWLICLLFSIYKKARIIGHTIFFIVIGLISYCCYLYYDCEYYFTIQDLSIGMMILFFIILFKVIIQCIEWEVK